MVTLSQKSGRKLSLGKNNTETFEGGDQGECETNDKTQPLDRVALQIVRGVSRHFRALNRATITEVPLADGRRCDLIALDEKGGIIIVEIKSSVADFRSDRKWPDYRAWCDRFYFAVLPEFPHDLIPKDCGLMLADRFGAECIREAPEHQLNAARRKALTLRFARCSAFRLQEAGDPDFRPLISA